MVLTILFSGFGAMVGHPSGNEIFYCVHVLRFVLNAGLLSSPLNMESSTASGETQLRVPVLPGGGASATE